MKPKANGSYARLLGLFDMDLSTPYNEREATLNNLVMQLEKIEDDLGWWDDFLRAHDLHDMIQQSCMFTDAIEEAQETSYDAGRESAWEDIDMELGEKFTEWMDKLVYFLKDKWVNLNKNQIQEVEDFIEAYPIPE